MKTNRKCTTQLIHVFFRMAAVIVLVCASIPSVQLGEARGSSNPLNTLRQEVHTAVGISVTAPIVAGSIHACALTPQGGVVCWGDNTYGRLGNGNTTPSTVPVAVLGLSSGVMSVAVGGFGACALTTFGQVYCWGLSWDASSSSVPVLINGLGNQIVQLAVSAGSHICALTSSGKVLCWGRNDHGQLGNGSLDYSSSTPVVAIAAGAVQIVAYEVASCAVMSNGEVLCWGWNAYGQLGNGITGGQSNVPVPVLKVGGNRLTGVSQVQLGSDFGCALVGSSVSCWGRTDSGELGDGLGSPMLDPRPYASPVLNSLGGTPLDGADQLSIGGMTACVHLSNGGVKCWGHNISGQVGNGSRINALLPVSVLNSTGTAALESTAMVTLGAQYACIFTSWEDAVPFYCWGANYQGQLGIGSIGGDRLFPQPVTDISGLGGGQIPEPQIVAGGNHTCSLTSDKGLECWGYNTNGQLGVGDTSDRLDPVNVAGLSSGVKSMALGNNFTCALLTWGRLKCWGENTHGQLGNGSKLESWLPMSASVPGVSVQQVATGSAHACVLSLEGSVFCWGDNTYGQLGNGNTEESAVPVLAISSGAVGIGLGGSTSCAVMSGGGIKCWGLGDSGQLGDGGSGSGYFQSLAVDVHVADPNLLEDAMQVAVGGSFACAVLGNRQVYCWGKNDSGQLGQGLSSPSSAFALPVVTEAGGDKLVGATQVSAGDAHACVRMYTDRLKCWGKGEVGQLGDGSSGSGVYSALPHTVVDHYAPYAPSIPYLEVVSQVTAGGTHSCAFLRWDGSSPYRCWGGNSHGQLGYSGTTSNALKSVLSLADSPYPNPVLGRQSFGSGPVRKIAAGRGFSCAVTAIGGVKCWGANNYGQLGNGNNSDSLTPLQVGGLLDGVTSLTAGESHVCALTAIGGVKCWGWNISGQLGDGSSTDRNTPVDVSGLSSGVVLISAGQSHTCALTSMGTVKCWGSNSLGQLGDGTFTDFKSTPATVIGLPSGVIGLASGQHHNCALSSAGGVRCWGDNFLGQIGNGTFNTGYVMSDVIDLTSGVVGLAAGYYHTCALTSYGGVKCWGAPGALGNGLTIVTGLPVDVTGLAAGMVSIAAHGSSTFALTAAGGVKAWGDNIHGQLGDGSTVHRGTPVDVIGLSSGSVTSIATGADHACAIFSGSSPLLCWGANTYGQLGTGDLIDTDEKGPVKSRWLTADGLVYLDEKGSVVIPLTVSNSALVVPPQPVTAPVTITATELPVPPAPCTNCVVPPSIPAITVSATPVMIHIHWVIHFPKPWPISSSLQAANGSAASVYDPNTLNLYHYVAGSWIPMLPCTGCSLDVENFILIANLDGPGIYEVMATRPTTNLYLPLVNR